VNEDLAVWWDGDADGVANMAADEALAAEAVRRGGPVARFYGWREPTVSLGAFQPLSAAGAIGAAAAIVRRPSGGGAIVHGTDLTYATAVPRDHPLGRTARPLYDLWHVALVEVLAACGLTARLSGPAEVAACPDAEAFLCFDRRADGDVVMPPAGRPARPDDPKILGSAQRRLAGAVLQHGSLLRQASAVVPRHGGLEELRPAGVVATGGELAACWAERVAAAWGGRVVRPDVDFRTTHGAAMVEAVRRFGDPAWLGRR
jgi:lipoate-protein ligase A